LGGSVNEINKCWIFSPLFNCRFHEGLKNGKAERYKLSQPGHKTFPYLLIFYTHSVDQYFQLHCRLLSGTKTKTHAHKTKIKIKKDWWNWKTRNWL